MPLKVVKVAKYRYRRGRKLITVAAHTRQVKPPKAPQYRYGVGKPYFSYARFYSKKTGKQVSREYARKHKKSVAKKFYYKSKKTGEAVRREIRTKSWTLLEWRLAFPEKTDKWIKAMRRMEKETKRARIKLSDRSPDFERYLLWAEENDEQAFEMLGHL